MTARGFYTLLFGALMLFTALSVGSAGAFLLGTAALLCWALSLLCVCAAALSCRAEQQFEGGKHGWGSVRMACVDLEAHKLCVSRMGDSLKNIMKAAL